MVLVILAGETLGFDVSSGEHIKLPPPKEVNLFRAYFAICTKWEGDVEFL